MRGNSFHQQLAKKTSSTVVTSDLFVVWYLGLWNKCRLIHGSFSGNPKDPRTERTRSRLTRALSKKRGIHLVIHKQIYLTQTEKGTIKMTGLTLYLQHSNWRLKTVYIKNNLPDSVTHPSSLMTCGWGFNVFITSSSDNKSFLSESGASAERWVKESFHCESFVLHSFIFQLSYSSIISYTVIVPFNILTATCVTRCLPRRPLTFPLATWPKAPLPIIFSIITFWRRIS